MSKIRGNFFALGKAKHSKPYELPSRIIVVNTFKKNFFSEPKYEDQWCYLKALLMLGGVHKLRLQDEVGRWLSKCQQMLTEVGRWSVLCKR